MLYPYRQYRAFGASASVHAVAHRRGQLDAESPTRQGTTGQGSTLSSQSSRTAGPPQRSPADSETINDDVAEPPTTVAAGQLEKRREEGNTNLTGNKQVAPPKCEDPFLVSWDEGEASNPQNWSMVKKWGVVIGVTMVAMVVGIGASITSAATEFAAERFGVSVEVMELQTALFLIGFGVSAPIFGPLSEVGGRVPVYVITLGLFSIFEIGSASANTITQRLVCRFFSGFFGSSPLSNAGGSVADIVGARERTYFFPVFAVSGFCGPVLGPIMGGYLGMNVGQEWCDWLTAILGGATTIALLFFMPETYAPVLLKFKARQMRLASSDDRYKSSLERSREQTSFVKHLRHALALPFLYLIFEPIVLFVSLYLTAVYIILFSDFEAYSIIFGQTFGFNAGLSGIAFVPVLIGLFLTLFTVPFIYRRWCRVQDNILAEHDQEKEQGKMQRFKSGEQPTVGKEAGLPEPEERLVLVMIGGILVPVAMFYQAWTTNSSLPVWPCLSAGILFGAGILCTFISSYQYIIDVYGTGSASALASLTFVRYVASGGAAMFARPMYNSLGARWAQTLLALISLVFTAVPWIFYFYGQRIRRRSRYAKA